VLCSEATSQSSAGNEKTISPTCLAFAGLPRCSGAENFLALPDKNACEFIKTVLISVGGPCWGRLVELSWPLWYNIASIQIGGGGLCGDSLTANSQTRHCVPLEVV